MRWPKRSASHSESGRRGDHRDDDRQVGQAGPHRAPAVGVLEVQDQPEHHAGHRDRRPDLRDRGAADGAVGEEARGRASATAVRRSCRTNATSAATAPSDRRERDRGEPAVLDAAGQRRSRPRPIVAMLSTAPGRSSASSVRSSGRSAGDAEPDADAGDQRDRGVDDAAATPSRTWASAVPPSSGPRTKPDMPTTIITRHRAHPQRLVVEEPEDERVGDRRHRRGGDAERGAQRDQLAGGA